MSSDNLEYLTLDCFISSTTTVDGESVGEQKPKAPEPKLDYTELELLDIMNQAYETRAANNNGQVLQQSPHACIVGRTSHAFREVKSLDDGGIERICEFCGEVAPSEVDEPTKLSGCMDLENFLNVCYGPPTSIYLESFLVPTLRRIKCRDRYVDIKILAKLRTYTSILRVCSQYGIPKVYAEDTMRILLKRRKGLYSKYAYIKILIELMVKDPRLERRVKDLRKILSESKR